MLYVCVSHIFSWHISARLAGLLKPDGDAEVPELNVSYKPQKISPRFEGSVRSLLHSKIRDMYMHPQFVTDVMKPMMMEAIIDNDVSNLHSTLARDAVCVCAKSFEKKYTGSEPVWW